MAGNGINAGHSLMNRFTPNTVRDKGGLARTMYMRVLMELAMNRFKWNNLPPGVDERHVEMSLMSQALCIFYFDEQYDRFMAVRGSASGPVNMYNNPTSFTVVAPQLTRRLNATRSVATDEAGNAVLDQHGLPVIKAPECVPIWANYLRVPDWDIVELYTSRLVELDKTIDITILNQRHPFIVASSVDQRKSFMEAYRQVQEGQPILWVTNALGEMLSDGANVLDVNVDKELVLTLMLAKSRVWNECMTMLGINNANQDKRERMVVDEVGANDEQVMSTRNVALKSRESACEMINEVFGLDISVEWNVEKPTGTIADQSMMMDEIALDDEEGNISDRSDNAASRGD